MKKLLAAIVAVLVAAFMLVTAPANAEELDSYTYDYLMNSKNYQLVEDDVKKTINISIAKPDKIKLEGYRLCIAKKVNEEDFDVAWYCTPKKFLPNQSFSWVPKYQLFGSNTFQAAVTVKEDVTPVDIKLGYKTNLDEQGYFTTPVTGGPDTSLNVENDYGSIHFGVNSLIYTSGKPEVNPIFVDPTPDVKGEAEFTPKEKVLVWFDKKLETSTMFETARSLKIEVDLTTTNSVNLLYSDEEWKEI